MRYLLLSALAIAVGTRACSAQPPPPPPPPPADPTWASTEGPAWNSFACPDGSVVFSAHLGGPRSLFFSEQTGEVELALEEDDDGARWVGGGVIVRNEPERRKRVTVNGEEIGGGACINDRSATVRDSLSGLRGVWIADARMNPKPHRTGLLVPDGFQHGDHREALFVGTDRVRVEPENIEAFQDGPSTQRDRRDLGLRFTPAAFGAIASLQGRHAGQPLVLLVDGRLVAKVEVAGRFAPGRVLVVYRLDDARLARLRDALDLTR